MFLMLSSGRSQRSIVASLTSCLPFRPLTEHVLRACVACTLRCLRSVRSIRHPVFALSGRNVATFRERGSGRLHPETLPDAVSHNEALRFATDSLVGGGWAGGVHVHTHGLFY